MKFAVALLLSGLLVAACRPDAPAAKAGQETLTIASASGNHEFHIEIADTLESQARGLMFRKTLNADAGMLFIYPTNEMITMWMKNTYIPLDMIFMNEHGRITHIAERTVPMSTAIIRSNGPARAVLEVNGGTANRLGIAEGDRVMSAVFPPR